MTQHNNHAEVLVKSISNIYDKMVDGINVLGVTSKDIQCVKREILSEIVFHTIRMTDGESPVNNFTPYVIEKKKDIVNDRVHLHDLWFPFMEDGDIEEYETSDSIIVELNNKIDRLNSDIYELTDNTEAQEEYDKDFDNIRCLIQRLEDKLDGKK